MDYEPIVLHIVLPDPIVLAMMILVAFLFAVAMTPSEKK
jgi:hypothetical protein